MMGLPSDQQRRNLVVVSSFRKLLADCLVKCWQLQVTRPHQPPAFPPVTADDLLSEKPFREQNQTLVAVSRIDGLFLTFAPSLRSEKRTSADRPLATTHAS